MSEHALTDPPPILLEGRVGRLGTSREDEPYVVPISFVWHDGIIYFHGSRSGRKMTNLQQNPRVCLEVDESEFVPGDDPCKLHFTYRSAIARGRARLVHDPDERLRALRLLSNKYAPGTGDSLTPGIVAGYENLAVIAIDVDVVTARQDPPKE